MDDISSLGNVETLIIDHALEVTNISNLTNVKHFSMIRCYKLLDLSGLKNVLTLNISNLFVEVMPENVKPVELVSIGSPYALTRHLKDEFL